MKTKLAKYDSRIALLAVLAGMALVLSTACDGAVGTDDECTPVKIVNLRAEAFTKTMPDGKVVTMWGYALDSRFGLLDGGSANSPGPVLNLNCATTLIVRLDNNLPVPTSLIINGQRSAEMVPVRNPDGRARSFTKETPAGNTEQEVYVFNQLEPGTYLYMSGSHPAVQVQMGLYGAIKKSAGVHLAYPGHPYDEEFVLLYSEVDSVLHDAVATDNYGPGKAVTSPIDYYPEYFLVNGVPYTANALPGSTARAGRRILFRVLNAGLKSHALMAVGAYGEVIAEDGNPYLYHTERYSLLMPAGQTKDIIVTVPDTPFSLVLDRMLNVSAGP